ncbi:MAG TPA: hypothetical protein DCW60_02540 [Sutterella sp.]|nr:hypothetical protein [Sutterella sp.]
MASLTDIFLALKGRYTIDPARDLWPFYYEDKIIGYVKPDFAHFLFTHSGAFFLEKGALKLKPSVSQKELKRVFKETYRTALAAGFAFEHDETLDVYPDRYDPAISVAPRGLFRALGLVTKSVHVSAWQAGKLVAQRRAAHKRVMPLAWDSFAGGLIAAAEEEKTACVREIYEETGLIAGTYELVRTARFYVERPVPEGFLREEVTHFDAILPSGLEITSKDGSAETFETKTEDEILGLINSGDMMPEAAFSYLDAIARVRGEALDENFYRHPIGLVTWDAPVQVA